MVAKKLKSGMGFHRQKLSDAFSEPLRLEKSDTTSGVLAWCMLVLVIIAYDVYAIKSKRIETLTKSFWRMTENKISGSIFTGAWLGLTFHLLIEKLIRKNLSFKGV